MTEALATRELAAESSATLAAAQTFKITTAPQYLEATEKLKGIMALKKRIADIFDPHIKRAHEAHKSLVAEKKEHETPILTAEALYKRAITVYQISEETKRRELEAKAQEEARRDRERLEARAAKAEASGKTEKAAALQVAAASVITPMIAPTTPKVSGISMRTTYRAEVVDLMQLVKAVAAGTVPLNAIEANSAFLNNQARAMKETLAYPGVKVVQETGIASRSA